MKYEKTTLIINFFFLGKAYLKLGNNIAFNTHPQAGELDNENSADLAIESAKVLPNRGIK